MSTASPTAYLLWAILSVLVRYPCCFDEAAVLLVSNMLANHMRRHMLVPAHVYPHVPPDPARFFPRVVRDRTRPCSSSAS